MAAALPIVRAQRAGVDKLHSDLVLIPVVEGRIATAVRPLGRGLSATLERRARAMSFRGRADDLLLHETDRRSIALVGLGSPDGGADPWARVGARGRREAERLGARRVAAYLGEQAVDLQVLAALAAGFLLAGYRFEHYRSDQRSARVESLTLVGEQLPAPAAIRPILEDVVCIAGGVFGARDLVNEPPSIATPRFLAEYTHRLAEGVPTLGAEVWEPKRIAREGLNGLLAVARGTHEEPRFIVLRHTVEHPRRRIALVGKGITFDSGGLSLKPARSMETMKYDMAGGAAVLHAVSVAAALGLPLEVTAFVPATENLPGGNAQKPGDVIRYTNGKTVEVMNTDAEGRLVLADALVVASRGAPDAIIDVATLTGSARVALGGLYACILGNDQALIDDLLAAGRASGEPLWQLPLVREYREDLRSAVADLKNVGTSDAGAIVAALFLGEFVEGIPWAHLDIAGPAFAEKDGSLAPRGATGYGVRLLVEYLRTAAGR
jgi:leucyl aminopeptidase